MSEFDTTDIYSPFYTPKEDNIQIATEDIGYSIPSDYSPPISQISQTIKSDNTSSITGWVNSVANILPKVGELVKSFSGSQATPLQTTQKATSPAPTNGGLFDGLKSLFGSANQSPQQAKESSNLMTFLLIGGIAVFLLLFMKR